MAKCPEKLANFYDIPIFVEFNAKIFMYFNEVDSFNFFFYLFHVEKIHIHVFSFLVSREKFFTYEFMNFYDEKVSRKFWLYEKFFFQYQLIIQFLLCWFTAILIMIRCSNFKLNFQWNDRMNSGKFFREILLFIFFFSLLVNLHNFLSIFPIFLIASFAFEK